MHNQVRSGSVCSPAVSYWRTLFLLTKDKSAGPGCPSGGFTHNLQEGGWAMSESGATNAPAAVPTDTMVPYGVGYNGRSVRSYHCIHYSRVSYQVRVHLRYLGPPPRTKRCVFRQPSLKEIETVSFRPVQLPPGPVEFRRSRLR